MDVLCPLGYKEMSLAGDLENLARTRKDLAGHKERDELLGHLPEIHIPTGEVFPMASVLFLKMKISPARPSSRRRSSATGRQLSSSRSPALSWAMRSNMLSHSGVEYSGWHPVS